MSAKNGKLKGVKAKRGFLDPDAISDIVPSTEQAMKYMVQKSKYANMVSKEKDAFFSTAQSYWLGSYKERTGLSYRFKPQCGKALKEIPDAIDINDGLEPGQPEIQVHLERSQASLYGVSAYDIASVIRSAIYGNDDLEIRLGGDEYIIDIAIAEELQKDISAIENIKIPTRNGGQILLKNVAKRSLYD